MKISAALPLGVNALLFDTARRRRELETRLVDQLLAVGCQEVVLPIIDYLEPYLELLRPEHRQELYQFVDRDGELLALRADFTPMVARLLAPRLGALDLPLRLFYRGDVVRFQEERAGRLREFYQLGVEVLGAGEEASERQLLELFLDLLTRAQSGSVTLVIGFAGALDELLTDCDAAERNARIVAVARRDRASLRGAPAALLEIAESGKPRHTESLGSKAAAELERLERLATSLADQIEGVKVVVDLAEMVTSDLGGSDRSYYDGLVFRAYAGSQGVAVGAGGRYDRLFARFGAPLSAMGFSIGLDRLGSVSGPDRMDPRP